MGNTQTLAPEVLRLKIKEAETCYSMGMIQDAIGVYEKILSGPPIKDTQLQASIQQKIGQLKKEKVDQEKVDNRGVTAEDISIFKKTLSIHEDVPTLLDGARALKELGLLDEAVAEFQKLLEFDFSKSDYSKFDYSPAKIIRDYLACMIELKSPPDVIKLAYKIIYQHALNDTETAELMHWLGEEMEVKSQNDLAAELYKKASEIDPRNSAISDKLSTLSSKISSSSRYDYLLSQKLVTTNQLQEALSISKKINKSIEFVLIDRFKVDQAELGSPGMGQNRHRDPG
jgi:tetratricopeptide (TPR) repeat protein